jgi:hypothetical protein
VRFPLPPANAVAFLLLGGSLTVFAIMAERHTSIAETPTLSTGGLISTTAPAVPLFPQELVVGVGDGAAHLFLNGDGTCKGDLPAFETALNGLTRGGDPMLAVAAWAVLRAAQNGGGCSKSP